jgi:hypothetical protein
VRGSLGALTCAFQAEDYLVQLRRDILAQYVNGSGLDWIVFWPYDEGGCGCRDDWPWGGKGFPRISTAVMEMARSMYPKLRTVASTWVFDKPVVNGSEYVGLDEFIKAKTKASPGRQRRSAAASLVYFISDSPSKYPKQRLNDAAAHGEPRPRPRPSTSSWWTTTRTSRAGLSSHGCCHLDALAHYSSSAMIYKKYNEGCLNDSTDHG